MKSTNGELLAYALIGGIVGSCVVAGCTNSPPSETHHTRPTATYSYDIGKRSYVRIYEARIDGVDYLFMGGGGAIIPKVQRPWFIDARGENVTLKNLNPTNRLHVQIDTDASKADEPDYRAASYATNATSSVYMGKQAGMQVTNAVDSIFLYKPQPTNVIMIGFGVYTTNSNEIVVGFTDGTEFRHRFPPGKVMDLYRDPPKSKAEEAGHTVTNMGKPAYFGSAHPGPWWPIGTNRFGDTAYYTNRAGQRLLLRTYRDLGNAIDFTWTLP